MGALSTEQVLTEEADAIHEVTRGSVIATVPMRSLKEIGGAVPGCLPAFTTRRHRFERGT